MLWIVGGFAVGALGALGFAPYYFAPCVLVFLAWMYFIVLHRPDVNLKAVFASLLGFYMIGLRWIVVPLTFDMSHHKFLIPFAICGLPSYMAFYVFVMLCLCRWLCRRFMIYHPLCFALCFSLGEYACGNMLTGFPWLMCINAMSNYPALLQCASWFGAYGVSMLLILFSALLYEVVRAIWLQSYNRDTKIHGGLLASILVMVIGCASWHYSRDIEFSDKKIRIVQGSIHNAGRDHEVSEDAWRFYYNSLRDVPQDVVAVIWPESSVLDVFKKGTYTDVMWRELCTASFRVPLVTGLVHHKDDDMYTSIVCLHGKDGKSDVRYYHKEHLVPFGEYMPFADLVEQCVNAAGARGIAGSGYKAGGGDKLLYIPGIGYATCYVCYEAIFPNEKAFDERADILLQCLNDGWFLDSCQPYQHCAIARMRAIENGMPLIRCANYGVSAVFDPCGREIIRCEVDEVAVRDVFVPKKFFSPTLYRKYGDIMYFILCGIVAILSFFLC